MCMQTAMVLVVVHDCVGVCVCVCMRLCMYLAEKVFKPTCNKKGEKVLNNEEQNKAVITKSRSDIVISHLALKT